jgi:bifunctional polynucleotide phosphatase/kinase
VLLVAPPSTGKSTLARRFDPSLYTTVNSDTLKTVEKCMAVAGEALRGGVKSVVVDNTNMEQAARARWVAFAREHGVSVSRL